MSARSQILDGLPGSMLVNMPNEKVLTLTELCTSELSQAKQDITVYESAKFDSSPHWNFVKAPPRNNLIEIVLENKSSFICGEDQPILSMHGNQKAATLQFGDLLVTKQGLQALNDDQWQLVIGSLFGRGDLKPKGKFAAVLQVYYQMNQSDYCEWKAQIMQTQLQKVPGKGNYGADRIGFVTLPFACSEPFLSARSIPDWMIQKLDARAIAVWYMDSGTLSKDSFSAVLPLGNHDEDTAVRVVNRLSQIDIIAQYRWKKRNIEIIVEEKHCRQFLQAIQPYCHSSLAEKLENGMIRRDKMDTAADLPDDHLFRRIANIPDDLRKQNAIFSVESGRRVMQVMFKDDAFLRMEPKSVIANKLQGDYTYLPYTDQTPYLWEMPLKAHKLSPVSKIKVLKNKADVDMYKLARSDFPPVVGFEAGIIFAPNNVVI